MTKRSDTSINRLNRPTDISVSLKRSDTSMTVIYHAMSLTVLYYFMLLLFFVVGIFVM
jgi:hypothetical protein